VQENSSKRQKNCKIASLGHCWLRTL